MIDFARALSGALRGQAYYFFREGMNEDRRTLRKTKRAQRRLIFTLLKNSGCYELDGWRYVRGVKTDEE